MAFLYINTYHPLVIKRAGRIASTALGLPPFVDGSIRREPDLEHPFPSISCLCRGDRFAPRLAEGDLVIYLATKRKYYESGTGPAHWRLVAALRVIDTFQSHEDAAAWYTERNLAIPNNCMVKGNLPNPLSHSHRYNRHSHRPEEIWLKNWDADYMARARFCSRFVACEPLHVDLSWNATVVHESDLIAVFGDVPGTRNPGKLNLDLFPKLMRQLGLAVRLSDQRTSPNAARSRRNTADPAPSDMRAARSAPPRSGCSPSHRRGPKRSRRGGC